MQDDVMDIRKVSDIFGISQRALRFYEVKKLLHPTRKGRVRQFSSRDLARLKLIQRGKACGFSLDEIRTILDLYDQPDGAKKQIEFVKKLAKTRLHELSSQREDIENTVNNIDALVDHVGDIEADLLSGGRSTSILEWRHP